MTYLEKRNEEYPSSKSNDIRKIECPYLYGYEEDPFCDQGMKGKEPCDACWNREMSPYDEEKSLHILDSGERRQFETGAVRDIQEGKGRCDLMPLRVLADVMEDSNLEYIAAFVATGNTNNLRRILQHTGGYDMFHDASTMFLEVAKHFEEGAKKYGENNWQKGLPVNCYIDSAVRHYLKWLRGDKDEPHDRAFVWNLMCCIWECDYSPRAENRTRTRRPKVEYLCDRKQCEKCIYPYCRHTTDISHAVNFTLGGPTGEHGEYDAYTEKETTNASKTE